MNQQLSDKRPYVVGPPTVFSHSGGVYLETATGVAHVLAESSGPVIERLLPYFTGKFTVGELVGSQPSSIGPYLEDLFGILFSSRAVIDVSAGSGGHSAVDLPQELLALAGHHSTEPVGRVLKLVDMRCSVAAASPALRDALGQTLGRLGLTWSAVPDAPDGAAEPEHVAELSFGHQGSVVAFFGDRPRPQSGHPVAEVLLVGEDRDPARPRADGGGWAESPVGTLLAEFCVRLAVSLLLSDGAISATTSQFDVETGRAVSPGEPRS